MPDAAEKELVQTRKRVDKLREQIRAEKRKAAAVAVNGESELTTVRLQLEEERLKAELAALKESNKTAGAVLKETVQSLDAPPVTPSESGSDAAEETK